MWLSLRSLKKESISTRKHTRRNATVTGTDRKGAVVDAVVVDRPAGPAAPRPWACWDEVRRTLLCLRKLGVEETAEGEPTAPIADVAGDDETPPKPLMMVGWTIPPT